MDVRNTTTGCSTGTCTDEELMSRVQRQDISAFEELFRRYDQRVFAFFWRLCANRQEAEDGPEPF
jgi:DNA-directed RNA polymerase specialized sigma24 family protein